MREYVSERDSESEKEGDSVRDIYVRKNDIESVSERKSERDIHRV